MGGSGDAMAAKDPVSEDMAEDCASCGRETPHSVSIQILTENADSDNAAFSREPYRVTRCLVCDDETAVRMNNV